MIVRYKEGLQESGDRRLGHQPGHAYTLHPGADVRYDRGDPDRAKERLAERAPGKSVGGRTTGRAMKRLRILHEILPLQMRDSCISTDPNRMYSIAFSYLAESLLLKLSFGGVTPHARGGTYRDRQCLLMTHDAMWHIGLFQVCDLFLIQFNRQGADGFFQMRNLCCADDGCRHQVLL